MYIINVYMHDQVKSPIIYYISCFREQHNIFDCTCILNYKYFYGILISCIYRRYVRCVFFFGELSPLFV